MRHCAAILLCLVAVSAAAAQDATPVKQPSAQQSAPTPFKQVVYEGIEDGWKMVIVTPHQLELKFQKLVIPCKYIIQDNRMRVTTAEMKGPDGVLTSRTYIYNIGEDGSLYNEDQKIMFVTGAALEKARPAFEQERLATLCLGNAKEIALACKIYALNNDGNFPAKLEDLVPKYLADASIFVSPLSPKKEPMGYDYFGAGIKDSAAPAKVLLSSKDTTADGRRVIVHIDSTSELKPAK